MLKALGKALAELAVLGANQKALVEHFRDNARIMIATEAGAEGINLQFCSLAINCDLPWIPQRIEQRLFGASDEVLGSIGSGVDFERRIAEIDQTCRTAANPPGALQQGLQAQQEQRVRAANQRNLGYFESKVQKLDAWADDLKGGLENDVKELDREIKDLRRTAAVAATLAEKLHWQICQRALEDKRNQLRRGIFVRQDEIDDQRRQLIDELEGRLLRQERVTQVFALQWELA